MIESSSPTKQFRRGSINDSHTVNAVKVCMDNNKSNKETIETLLSLGIRIHQRTLSRIKKDVRDLQNRIDKNQYPPRENIMVESVYFINEQIKQMRNIESTTKDENTKIKAANVISTYIMNRLRLYRFPLND